MQKRAVELARRMAKPVIVATQMLESMISSPRPTRAETSDVANAVLDGADAVMLSGETSVGEYPIVTVADDGADRRARPRSTGSSASRRSTEPRTQGGAITLAAVEVADFVEAKYLCVFTESGDTARRMSRSAPQIPMLAFTPGPGDPPPLALTWGVESFLVAARRPTPTRWSRQVDEYLLENDRAPEGRQGRRHLRFPSRNPRLDQRHPRPPRRRRPARGGSGLPPQLTLMP